MYQHQPKRKTATEITDTLSKFSSIIFFQVSQLLLVVLPHSSSSRTQAKLAQPAGAYSGQPQHEATKSNATPSWMGCLSNVGPPRPCRSPPPLPEFCEVALVSMSEGDLMIGAMNRVRNLSLH